jgi:cephalosporin hydroxylase
MPADMFADRPWGIGDNPKTAVWAYLKLLRESGRNASDGKPLRFEVDKTVENKIQISVAPDGYLKRV